MAARARGCAGVWMIYLFAVRVAAAAFEIRENSERGHFRSSHSAPR